MGAQSATQRREAAGQVKIVGADVSVNRKNEIHGMIARRAYELFESRGFRFGHDIDDWVDAESEILHACRHELKETAGALIFLAQLPGSFAADQISVSVEPRRLIVSGEREFDVTCGGNAPAHTEKRTQRILQIEELPLDVHPAKATTKLQGETLEIVMPTLAGTSKHGEKSEAASSTQ